jgi:hypothetical protein
MGLFDFLKPTQRSKQKDPGEVNRLVVIPVDETKQSLHALEWAIGNVYKQDTDQLHLLSIVPRVAGPYPAEVNGFEIFFMMHSCSFRQSTQAHATAAVAATAAGLSCTWTTISCLTDKGAI